MDAFISFIVLVPLYFLPTIFAWALRHKRTAPLITVINIFVGWTIVGWVILLGWSLTKDKLKEKVPDKE